MSKRADGKYPPSPRDFYRTPAKAIRPLLPYLSPGTRFADPCAGDGFMAAFLSLHGHDCVDAYDIKPMRPLKARASALHLPVRRADRFQLTSPGALEITNPPWSCLDRVLDHLRESWLLLSADWMHTQRAQPYLPRCSLIVAVGRVSWMHNGKGGYDNAAWHRFHNDNARITRFVNTW
jgi:hypothetical protein